MRIKINGKDIDYGDRVSFETSSFSDGAGFIIACIGIIAIFWQAKDLFQ